MGMKKTILIVDDDRMNLVTAQKFLVEEYKVVGVNSGKQAFKYLMKYRPDLILLDIFMPEIGGFEVMKLLQENKDRCKIPVIFLTADRKTETESKCFQMGAHDFITKPFDLEVLSAKVQAVLRRAYAFQSQTPAVVECGGAVLNLSDMSLSYEGGRRELSKNEFRILQLLFEHAGQTVSRESIMKRLWDNECFVDDNTLTVNINRLRRTLKEIGLEDFIRTRKGVGYQLDAGIRDG